MLYDAGINVPADSELSAEICIIGSGAAAISLAHSLISSGRKVILLESSRFNACARTSSAVSRLRPSNLASLNVQTLYGGSVGSSVSDTDPMFLTRSRLRCYGGTTNCWGGWTRPLSRVDFDRRDLNPLFVWPIARDELHAFYNAAIQYCSLGAWDVSAYDDPAFWIGKTRYPIALLPLREGSPLRTGVIAVINGTAIAGGRLAFQMAWGPDLEEASNISIYRNASARYLDAAIGNASIQRVNASTMAEGKRGHDFTVKADRYVIAAGGIETTRLLLVSDGLGNAHDHVGRYFMVHPVNDKAAVFTAGIEPHRSVRTYFSGAQAVGGVWPPTLVAILVPTESALKRSGTGNFRLRIDSWSRINFCWEQVPNPDSRITLDQTSDPIFGDPMVRLNWQLTPLDVRTQTIGLQMALEELAGHGYLKRYEPRLAIDGVGDHHMGTTRMSQSPCEGVVDRNCRVHGVDNLYIASSSVFPTGGFTHPTLTVIALALRLAAHLTQCKHA